MNKPKRIKTDPLISLCLLFLMLNGALFVYSASYYTAEKTYGDKFFFFKKQIIGYVIGIAVYVAFSIIDYRKLKKFYIVFYIISAVLLGLVLTPLGKEVYGAKRWVGIGSFTMQPSELAKFAFVLFTAMYFSSDMSRAKTFKGFLPVVIAGGLFCLLIIAEPNMSVTVCMGAVMLIMLFIAGVPLKNFVYILLPVLAAIPVLIIAEPYRLKRFAAFLDPFSSPKGEGYQLLQSLYALGSGGFFGVGIFNSRQKLRFLPFAESDFILSIIGEETGFFGIIILLTVCLVLSYRIIRAGKNCGNFFGYLLCVGIASVFIVQTAVNALVVTGSIPPTGIPFPLVSSGNTQIMAFMAAFGVVNNISAQDGKQVVLGENRLFSAKKRFRKKF